MKEVFVVLNTAVDLTEVLGIYDNILDAEKLVDDLTKYKVHTREAEQKYKIHCIELNKYYDYEDFEKTII